MTPHDAANNPLAKCQNPEGHLVRAPSRRVSCPPSREAPLEASQALVFVRYPWTNPERSPQEPELLRVHLGARDGILTL